MSDRGNPYRFECCCVSPLPVAGNISKCWCGGTIKPAVAKEATKVDYCTCEGPRADYSSKCCYCKKPLILPTGSNRVTISSKMYSEAQWRDLQRKYSELEKENARLREREAALIEKIHSIGRDLGNSQEQLRAKATMVLELEAEKDVWEDAVKYWKAKYELSKKPIAPINFKPDPERKITPDATTVIPSNELRLSEVQGNGAIHIPLLTEDGVRCIVREEISKAKVVYTGTRFLPRGVEVREYKIQLGEK